MINAKKWRITIGKNWALTFMEVNVGLRYGKEKVIFVLASVYIFTYLSHKRWERWIYRRVLFPLFKFSWWWRILEKKCLLNMVRRQKEIFLRRQMKGGRVDMCESVCPIVCMVYCIDLWSLGAFFTLSPPHLFGIHALTCIEVWAPGPGFQ